MKKFPITKEGLLDLKDKLDKLKNFDRKKVIDAIKTAREYGDLKENAEYHAAKEEQYLIEKKIKELEQKILLAEEIDICSIENSNKVIFGATVKIKDLNSNLIFTYKIVGEDEADLQFNKISINSPLARAMILKSKSDLFNLKTLNGVFSYRIEDIMYI